MINYYTCQSSPAKIFRTEKLSLVLSDFERSQKSTTIIKMRKVLAPSTSTTNKVLSKKKKPADIEKIIGNTVTHHSCAAASPNGEEVAYCAGCTIVIYSPKKNKQLRFLQNPSENKPLTSVCFSSDGKRVAAGESGYQPSVLVWDACTGRLICDLKEDRHKFGVRFVVFSPDSKYLVSVGNEHDGTIKIWANKAKSFELVCSKTNPRKVSYYVSN